MNFIPERKQYSIVLIGDFNPAMFHPEWFTKNDIISQEECDFAKSQTQSVPLIVTSQLTMFKTSQLNVKIETKRFQVVCEKEPFVTLKDFITKTFENLGGYIITAYGINYSAHYNVNSLDLYQTIGDNLAPKKYWEYLLEDEISGSERKSGLTSIQMQKMKADNSGFLSIVLQPSVCIKPGVFIGCNNHTNVSDEDSTAEIVMENLGNRFDDIIANMKEQQVQLLTKAIEQ
mgnify:FL=1